MDSLRSRGDHYVAEALKYEGALRSRLWRWTGNQADVEELLHDIYVRLFEAGNEGREIRNVFAYCVRIGWNLVADRGKRDQLAPIDLVEDMAALGIADDFPSPERQITAQQELAMVWSVVSKLSFRCRHVFMLHKYCRRTHLEIAEQLGISIHAVRYEIDQACAKIRPLHPHIFAE